MVMCALSTSFITGKIAEKNYHADNPEITRSADISEAAGKWAIDDSSSSISFKTRSNWVLKVKGAMTGLKGNIVITEKIEDSSVKLSMETNTVKSGIKVRDNHLKTEQFFAVEKYPEITFKGIGIFEVNKEYKYILKGDLTIKDVTKTIEIPFDYNGIQKENGMEIVTFTGEVILNRFDYNVDYKMFGMGDDATISFTIKAKKI